MLNMVENTCHDYLSEEEIEILKSDEIQYRYNPLIQLGYELDRLRESKNLSAKETIEILKSEKIDELPLSLRTKNFIKEAYKLDKEIKSMDLPVMMVLEPMSRKEFEKEYP